MDATYHQKYHRHNHHTIALSSEIYPDASHDPIASPEQPFQGDFVLDGQLISKGLDGKSGNISVNLSSSHLALHTYGDVNIFGNVMVRDLSIIKDSTHAPIRIISTPTQSTLSLNSTSFDVRIWKTLINSQLDDSMGYSAPLVIDIEKKDYVDSLGNFAQSFVNVIFTGTRPMSFQWYRNSEILTDARFSFLRTNDDGEFTVVARNKVGETSAVVVLPFDEDIINNHKYLDLTTHDGFDLYLDYTYIVKDLDYITDHHGVYIIA